MTTEDFLFQAFIFLSAAVVAVPISKKVGLGSVLGYLIAGFVIGPSALELVGDEIKDIMHFAEFGVVMMLFLVGLELQPSKLWAMKVPILGLGGAQVTLTSVCGFAIGLGLGLPWEQALAISLILSLSSTAIVLSSLSERGMMKTSTGNQIFSVLLFQDIAMLPILAFLPLLAMEIQTKAAESNGLIETLIILGSIAGIILAGRFLIRPIFRIIATTKLRELFTAAALTLVIGITLLMHMIGLSAALGAFVAGVVLADNEYRHEIEAEIEPFKGLLLGLFFITVGASININVLLAAPWIIAGVVATLMTVKFIVVFSVARVFRQSSNHSTMIAAALCQGGEFAFVLFNFAQQNQVLPLEITQPLTVAVAISMALAPLVMNALFKLVETQMVQKSDITPTVHDVVNKSPRVIIAGFGRFGQIVGRLVRKSGHQVTILEHDANQVELLRQFNNEVFFGDAGRKDLLELAGAHDAEIFVIAIDDHEKSLEILHMVKKHFPNLTIFARARGRREAHELHRAGADKFIRETFDSALHLGNEVLQSLGSSAQQASAAAQAFRQHDEHSIFAMTDLLDDGQAYISTAIANAEELESILQKEFISEDKK